jgi:Mce-associated membrane protein
VTDEEKTTVVGDADNETKADETKADETKAEAKADDAKADETKADETKADETSDEEATDEAAADAETAEVRKARTRSIDWGRVAAYGVLPALALLLVLAAGYLKYVDNSVRDSDTARIESMQVAKDSTIAMLSYQPDTVDKQLNDARNLLTGDFQNSYTGLINDVVIPGAKQKKISAVATVPAAASVSAAPNHAVVLVFVNQTVVVGADAPTDTASSVKVTLEKHGDKWLISEFQPV